MKNLNNSRIFTISPQTYHQLHSHHFLLRQRAMASSSSAIVILSPLLFIVFVAASSASFVNVDDSLLISSSNQREFDYFKLALQWPGTYCRNTHKCCQKNGCCRNSGAPKHFTIHGLWPDYNDGSWPSCCTKSEFDENEISTLRKALDEYWPTLSCGSPSSCYGHKGSFWGHEWEKHGTCSSPVVRDEYNYFLTGLNVYFKYNVTQVLFEAGYVPSNTEKYPLGGIISAIENAFHLSPSVACSGDALKELYLCFYKDFKPRDCATDIRIKQKVDYSKHSCPKYVSLPTYDSSGQVITVERRSWILVLIFIIISL